MLSPDKRIQLDGIVGKMTQNQESPETIQFVVDDFKKKYSAAVEEPPKPKSMGLLGGIKEDFEKRKSNLQAYGADNKGFQDRKYSVPETIAHNAGQGAGFVADVGGRLFGQAGKALSAVTPDFIENPIKDKLKEGVNNALARPIIPGTQTTLGEGIQGVQRFAEENPRLAQNVSAAGNIASAVPVVGAAKVGLIGAEKAAPVVKSALLDTAAWMTKKTERQIESSIVKKFEKGVRPLLPGKTTPGQLDAYRDDVVQAVKTINENKPNLSFTDEVGEAIKGQSPKSLQQLADAVEQTKKSVFGKYDALAKQAGGAGLKLDTVAIGGELDAVITNKALSITNPKAIQYAKGTQARLQAAKTLDATTAQDVIQNYNKSLEAFYRNPSYDSASQAAIDAMVANRMRQALDEGISGLTGQQYQALKNQYGALKAIERDVIKASLRDARKNVKGLIDFTDVFSGGQVVSGILSLNPGQVASGLTQKGIAEFYKYLNNPNRAIEKMFKASEGLQPLNRSSNFQPTIAKSPNTKASNIQAGNTTGTEKKQGFLSKYLKDPNMGLAIKDVSKRKPLLAKENQVFKGFPDLTTKILDKLKGRSTVSKQFISDLTNAPDLKQSERDLIRTVLAGESDQVAVKDFANKVKTELLPLKTLGGGKFEQAGFNRYESITLPDELRGPVASYKEKVYESPIKTSAGGVHFKDASTENYFAHTRIEDIITGEKGALVKNIDDGRLYEVVSNKNFKSVQGGHRGASGLTVKDAKTGEVTTIDASRFTEVKDSGGSLTIGKSKLNQNSTRRVIELQSDLFQKGRLEAENSFTWQGQIDRYLTTEKLKERNRLSDFIRDNPASDKTADAYKRIIKIGDEAREVRKVETSKLEPYRNTWHERVIREEVKQAAKDGKTKLQFPTGETAMKIEGLGRVDSWEILGGGNGWLSPENMIVGQEVHRGGGRGAEWIITDVLGDGKFKAVPKRDIDSWSKGLYKSTDEALEAMKKEGDYESLIRGAEQFDISGKVDTQNPIYRFYEKEVGRYLSNKYKATRITDPQGVSWWELSVPKDAKRLPIEAFAATPLLALPQKKDEDRKPLLQRR